LINQTIKVESKLDIHNGKKKTTEDKKEQPSSQNQTNLRSKKNSTAQAKSPPKTLVKSKPTKQDQQAKPIQAKSPPTTAQKSPANKKIG